MNRRDLPAMPVPYSSQGGARAHPDSYNSPAIAPTAPYGSRQDPNACRVEVSFPHQQSAYAPNGYQTPRPGFQPTYGGFPGAAAQPAYGNPVVVHVSSDDWVNQLADAMASGQPVDLVFDATAVIGQLVNIVRDQVGSFAEIARDYISDAIDNLFSMGLAHRNPNVPAEAMLAPVAIAAIVAAITVVALAIIYAVVAIYNTNKSAEIAQHAIDHGYGVEIDVTNQGSGSGDGWFDFLNGSRWRLTPGSN